MTDATCTCLEKNGNACTIFIPKNAIDLARSSKLPMHVIWEFSWSNYKRMDWLPFPHIVRCNKTKGRSPSSSAVMLTVEPYVCAHYTGKLSVLKLTKSSIQCSVNTYPTYDSTRNRLSGRCNALLQNFAPNHRFCVNKSPILYPVPTIVFAPCKQNLVKNECG